MNSCFWYAWQGQLLGPYEWQAFHVLYSSVCAHTEQHSSTCVLVWTQIEEEKPQMCSCYISYVLDTSHRHAFWADIIIKSAQWQMTPLWALVDLHGCHWSRTVEAVQQIAKGLATSRTVKNHNWFMNLIIFPSMPFLLVQTQLWFFTLIQDFCNLL